MHSVRVRFAIHEARVGVTALPIVKLLRTGDSAQGRKGRGRLLLVDAATRVPGLGSSFVNDVERCLRSSPKATESSCRSNLPDARLAGLRTQAQSDFLRSR